LTLPDRFNTGEGQEENHIVTSSGPFVIKCKSNLTSIFSLRYLLTLLRSPNHDRELQGSEKGPTR
jgi:hypothetical protein